QNHRVARSGAKEVARLRREVGTKVEVRAVGMVEMLEVVYHRHARESLGKIQCRAEAAVADDQVGLEVGHRFARLVYGVGVPDGVLERAAEVMRGLACATTNSVWNRAHAVQAYISCLGDEVAAPSSRLREVMGDVAELRREVLVDEENTHCYRGFEQG